MRSVGLTGARTTDLARQLEICIALKPDIAIILIGANDLRDMVPPWRSAALLGEAVTDSPHSAFRWWPAPAPTSG